MVIHSQEVFVKKVKNLFLFIVLSVFIFNVETAQAKIGLNVLNESHENLQGYRIKLQVCQDAQPICTQIIDVSDIPPTETMLFNLDLDLEKHLKPEISSKGKTCLSLLDKSGNKVAKDDCSLNLYDLSNYPVFLIKLNAVRKEASIDSLPDRFGMALLEAPQS